MLLGAVFILVVYFMPQGLVGGARWVRARLARAPVAEPAS
jgi:hypothetical protein